MHLDVHTTAHIQIHTHTHMHTHVDTLLHAHMGCGPLVVYPMMEGLLRPIPGCSLWLTLGFGSNAYRLSASMVASRGLRQSHLSTLLAEMFIEVELGVIRCCSFFLHLSQLDA